MPDRVLYLIGCAAPPVQDLGALVDLLRPHGWRTCVIPTPAAADWFDTDAMARMARHTGFPVRSTSRRPDDPTSLPPADAALVAPATFNTINKLAGGVADNFALGLLHEGIGRRMPTVVMPYAKPALAAHPLFAESLSTLASWGVKVLENELVRPPTKSQPFRWQRLEAALLEHLR
ncbi:flavoprotein [Labedaea rhizosphaerae]|uniref:Flavoprotein n=1 Tax=Labedaea rhizosphaerae TaxID=598644 RepID=A0A4R6S3I8_LABRH|nr:flavoprotein [Labedaea rhizosphaerae]TDP93647.1 flavoprotein [Labedaea rhizosphaerae]